MERFQAIVGATIIAFTTGAAGAASAENVLRWASAAEALTFDPHSVAHGPTMMETSQVYESLVGFNSRYEIEPSLAVAWHLIDPTTWQFELRQGVRFHDGTPFTAEDVVFSLNRAMSSTSGFKGGDFATITAVEAVDGHTVRIKTTGPNMILPDQLNIISMMSKRWAGEHNALLPAAYGDDMTYAEIHANGTGPFKLESFEEGVGTVMTRNPEWWGLAQNPHNLDRIVHTVIKDPGLRLQALLGGELDFLNDPPFADLDRDRGYAGLEA